MSARSRVVSADEELGKRDDDFFRSGRSRSNSTSFDIHSFLPWRWRRRRILTALGVIAVLYLLISSLPAVDPTPEEPAIRPKYPTSFTPSVPARLTREPTGAPPRDISEEDEDETSKHYYNGVVRFYKLADSLHRISRTGGALTHNRNVLYVASSLKSMANLVPMACAMAEVDRNYVHLALFGRSTIPMDELLEINGVDTESCTVLWHDARGDFAEYSSDARAESATRGAMKHINDFMHPQAMIMDDGVKEELFFTRAMRIKAKDYGFPLIEVPAGKYEDFLWMTRLEANSLANWFSPTVDIVVQAPRASSGSLIRLVRSLVNADYRGLKVPRLTIELPSDIEHYAQKFLHDLQWPPVHDNLPSHETSLTLHHRIPSSRQSSEQASLRFVESFYPSRPENHHILVLSPQAELSPRFFQHLHYQILEHRHSSWLSSSAESMLGISLDVPSTYLNGTAGFTPPEKDSKKNETASPFLYQAPSSTATLIFGDRWAQFHAFLSKRVQATSTGKKTAKLVAETEPAWMEYLLELMRARDWTVLLPAATMNLVTVHNELAQVPEEFSQAVAETDHVERDVHPNNGVPLHLLLESESVLERLPVLSFDGREVNQLELNNAGVEYREYFRGAFGGCDAKSAKKFRVPDDVGAKDLFCLPGWDKDEGGDEQVEFDAQVELPSAEDLEELDRAMLGKLEDDG